MNFQSYIIDTPESWKDLVQYVDSESFEYLSLDVETDSEKEKIANLYGVGLCFQPGQAFYIPVRGKDTNFWWTENQEQEIAAKIGEWGSKLKLIGHNVLYDVLVLENNWGMDLSPHIYSDTILQKHALDEENPFALKEIAVKYLGEWADKAQEILEENVLQNGGVWKASQKEMYKADTSVLGEYCAWDTMLCRALFDKFEPQIQNDEELRKLFYEEETMPLYREVTINMKRHGFPIDVQHFEKLRYDLTRDINNIEDHLLNVVLKDEIEPFVSAKLEKEIPVKKGGNFPKVLAEVVGVRLPINPKTNTVTMAAAVLKKLIATTEDINTKDFYTWIVEDVPIPEFITDAHIRQVQAYMYFSKEINKDKKHVFNLGSNDHLAWLFFDHFQKEPANFTEKGNPQIDDVYLESIKHEFEFVQEILNYKKLNKLLSTYVEGALERHIDGVIYTSMLQFGTTSGRFASRNLNMQNLPAVKKGKDDLVSVYTSAIRKGYIAGEGNKLVSSDFNSLEPHLAAFVSQDPGLVDIFVTGKDFYSAIAIKQFGITDAHPYKDGTPDSFPVKYPDLRALVKTYALAAFYGAEAPRIAQVINEGGKMTNKEAIQKADELLKGYFKGFKGVRQFIEDTHWEAKTKGYVTTAFGRKRHLGALKAMYERYGDSILNVQVAAKRGLKQERRIMKNLLNNAVNFKIQGLASHAANRAMLYTQRGFRKTKLEANVILMIHDELIANSKKDHAEKAAGIMRGSMENCLNLGVIKLKAGPVVCNNLGEAKD